MAMNFMVSFDQVQPVVLLEIHKGMLVVTEAATYHGIRLTTKVQTKKRQVAVHLRPTLNS